MDETRHSDIYARETESRIRHREFLLQGALSRRVYYLKREEGGIGEMCEYSERIFNGGKEEGLREGCEKMVRLMREQGVDEAIIKKIMASAAEREPVQV